MFPVSNNSVQIEENTLENHSTDLNLTYNNDYSTTICIQPQRNDIDTTRRPIPVLTNWQSDFVVPFLPMSGLDFLSQLNQLHVQRSVELSDLLSNDNSENSYTIKRPEGETVYNAREISSSFQRLCFGPSRSFVITIYDQTHQDVMILERRLACGLCSFLCYLQVMDVFLPTGELLGTIEQKFSVNTPIFFAYNTDRNVLFYIEGPTMCGACAFSQDIHFKVYSCDSINLIGIINRQWDQVQLEYNLRVQYLHSSLTTKYKALILASSFVLDYMYFSKPKWCKCMC